MPFSPDDKKTVFYLTLNSLATRSEVIGLVAGKPESSVGGRDGPRQSRVLGLT